MPPPEQNEPAAGDANAQPTANPQPPDGEAAANAEPVPNAEPAANPPPANAEAATIAEPVAAPAPVQTNQSEPDRKLRGLKGVNWVATATEIVLKQAQPAPTRENPLSGRQVYDAVERLGINIPVEKSTFSAYLSEAAKNIESPFSSTGRGRGGGYYLSETTEALAEEARTSGEQATGAERAKEKWLYPSLVSWIIGRQYKAKDTSALRSLGKWGNPDVTGIAVKEHLTRIEIEVATIEAKVGFGGWEVDFFQAVSQRRFANRAYFAFALPEEASDKLPSDLRYYSELFSVGVLVVELDNEMYKRLTTGELQDDDKQVLEDANNDLTREILAAPWHHVPLNHQRRFCEALGITDIQSLILWGGGAPSTETN